MKSSKPHNDEVQLYDFLTNLSAYAFFAEGNSPMIAIDEAACLAPLDDFAGHVEGDPRTQMASRLPSVLQPFLTWLTAKPAPGESAAPKSPLAYLGKAALLVLGGSAAAAMALRSDSLVLPLSWILLGVGLISATSGLGLFQVVIFHHCSHGTVFRTWRGNQIMGRAISAILLFKHFDRYQAGHMLHHNANKLFTDDDEFTDFVVGLCDLAPSLNRRKLWRRLLLDLVSPTFHGRFLLRRLQGSLCSHDRLHNAFGIGVWGSLLIGATATHTLSLLLVCWIIPVTVLLQIATVFRILCEHRFPAPEVIRRRGKTLVCLATAGVFPGASLPESNLNSLPSLMAWTRWWTNMLVVQLFVRVFILVGDAPCHDFHHRRPANKNWTDYIHARQLDYERECPGFPHNYTETWGLFRAIDQNFAAMAHVPADFLTEPSMANV